MIRNVLVIRRGPARIGSRCMGRLSLIAEFDGRRPSGSGPTLAPTRGGVSPRWHAKNDSPGMGSVEGHGISGFVPESTTTLFDPGSGRGGASDGRCVSDGPEESPPAGFPSRRIDQFDVPWCTPRRDGKRVRGAVRPSDQKCQILGRKLFFRNALRTGDIPHGGGLW